MTLADRSEALEDVALAVKKDTQFQILTCDASHVAEVMRKNLGSGGLSEFDLDRIHISTGGSVLWELPGLNGFRHESIFEAIIVHYRDPRAFWRSPFGDSGGNASPDCSSHDGETGHGDPGGQCSLCPMAAFGSATDSRGNQRRGQACRQMRILFCLLPDQLLPVAVVLPRTSLGVARKFFQRLASAQREYSSVVVRFTLEKMRNLDGVAYAQVALEVDRLLSVDEAKQIDAYATTVRQALDGVRITQADCPPTNGA